MKLTVEHADLTADRTALVPGKPLLDAVKAAADDTTIDLALPGAAGSHGLFSLHSQHSTTTLRALEGDLPKYQSLFPTEFSQTATVEIAALTTEAVDFHFTTSTKPAVLRGHNSDDQALRYLLMPIRLKG